IGRTGRRGSFHAWPLYSAARGVEEAPRRCDLVLKIGKLALQLLEILIGLEVRIGFGEREDLAECALQLRLGGGLSRGTLRGEGGIAGFDGRSPAFASRAQHNL